MRVARFGFWISGFRFRVSGFRFRVPGFGFRVSGFGFQVSGFGFRVSGFGFRVSFFRFSAQGSVFRVSGFGFGSRHLPEVVWLVVHVFHGRLPHGGGRVSARGRSFPHGRVDGVVVPRTVLWRGSGLGRARDAEFTVRTTHGRIEAAYCVPPLGNLYQGRIIGRGICAESE